MIDIFNKYMVRPRENLTKWLNKCEGSVPKAKRKIKIR